MGCWDREPECYSHGVPWSRAELDDVLERLVDWQIPTPLAVCVLCYALPVFHQHRCEGADCPWMEQLQWLRERLGRNQLLTFLGSDAEYCEAVYFRRKFRKRTIGAVSVSD